MVADLELVAGGRPLRFPAVWLRDNCPCPECLDPGTGQKLIDITDIPNGLAITLIEDAGQSVLVTFGPDQHRSVFSRAWLAAHALDGDGTATATGGPRTTRNSGSPRTWTASRHELAPATWPGGRPRLWRRCCGWASCCCATCRPSRAGCSTSRRASATSGRPTTAGCSTCGWSPPPATSPTPAGRSGRTPTTRTATRRRPCSCCTACAPRAKGETPGWWTASRPRRRSGPLTRNRSPRWRIHPFRSVMSIKRLNYAPACRSSSSARAAGSAGSGSTTGRCGRCGGHMPRSPRSTPPTGGGLSCSRGRNGGSTCG